MHVDKDQSTNQKKIYRVIHRNSNKLFESFSRAAFFEEISLRFEIDIISTVSKFHLLILFVKIFGITIIFLYRVVYRIVKVQ